MNAAPEKTLAELTARDALTAAQREEMFALLAAHFEGVTRAQFAGDLAEKNWVLRLTRDGRLVGFSTLLAYETEFEGERLAVIYSGDTIVAPEAWGGMTLPRAWIAAVNRVRATLAPARCVWLLLTSGFRTYRFLPVFWREFWPRCDAPTPVAPARLAAHLAREKFGGGFDAGSGIVRLPNPQRLRAGLNEVPAGRARDSHIAFFLARNPGHARGDELVCLTELTAENLTAAGRRMVCAPSGSRSAEHGSAGEKPVTTRAEQSSALRV